MLASLLRVFVFAWQSAAKNVATAIAIAKLSFLIDIGNSLLIYHPIHLHDYVNELDFKPKKPKLFIKRRRRDSNPRYGVTCRTTD